MNHENPDQRPRGITFDRTINLGHILTFLGFVITGMIAWSTLDKRVVVLEEARKAQAQIDRHQDEVLGQNLSTIRESLTEIKRSIERIEDRQQSKK